MKPAVLIAASFMAVWPASPNFASHALDKHTPRHRQTVCEIISREAQQQKLPEWFFARLIWQESRFDPNAVSPKGAQGIAQFMPATAEARGLLNPFAPAEAIQKAAHYLSELVSNFGNLGLAAAAYNAGEDRVQRWLAGNTALPLETLDYIFSITGRPADEWAEPATRHAVPPAGHSMVTDCAILVARGAESRFPAISGQQKKMENPWGVQVAGSHSEAAALASFRKIRARFSDLLAGTEPLVIRKRNPGMGRKRVVNVRIGTATRAEADRLCAKLLAKGGACVVLRN
jgi:hypothetical protein